MNLFGVAAVFYKDNCEVITEKVNFLKTIVIIINIFKKK